MKNIEELKGGKHWTFSESFAGIGAWGKAINRVTNRHGDTCELKYYYEIDKYASNAFAAMHDVYEDMNRWDITEVVEDLPEVDVFFYSPPCQTFSIAGKREGTNVDKGNLFYHAVHKIEKSNPKYCIMENVRGLPSGDTKKDFYNMLWYLESKGYVNDWKILNTKDYGIPQNRERVFVVSIRKDLYDQGKRFEWPKPMKLELRLKDLLESEVDEKYYLSQKMIDFFIKNTADMKAKGNGFAFKPTEGDSYAKAITCNTGSRMDDNFIKVQQVGNLVETDSFGGNPQRGRVYSAEGLSPSLNCVGGGGLEPKVMIAASRGRDKTNPSDRSTGNKNLEQTLEINNQGISNALTTVQKDNLVIRVPSATNWGCEKESPGDSIMLDRPESTTIRGRVGNQASQTLTTSCNVGYFNGITIRKLTPLECFRLQGFDDQDYYKAVNAYDKAFGTDKYGNTKSDSQMYKRAGNSITVNVIEEILEQLLYDRVQSGTQISLF